MKFVPLIWSGIWRKPGRTLLIFLQISVAFALFGVLQGMKTGTEQAIANARGDLLLVHSRVSAADRLPLGHYEKIKSIPGVKTVTIADGFIATYQNPNEVIPVVAFSPDKTWPTAYPNFIISPEALDAFIQSRTGTLVSQDLAKKYGWKTGDRIPLKSTTAQVNGSTDWAFDVVGSFFYNGIDSSADYIIVNFAYFDEARLNDKGTAGRFNVVASDPREAATIADEIDQRFANSAHETRTESLREQAQSQMQAIGDLDFVIRWVVCAGVLALLFATTTMMMQTTRERTPELAVLKTLGFTDAALFLLITIEALIVCVAAAILGLALADLAFPFAAQFVPGLTMPRIIILIGLASALPVALISVALPALRAARLEIVNALAGR